MNDLDIIKKINKRITFKLNLLEKINFYSCGYSINENKQVTALSLYNIHSDQGFGIDLNNKEFNYIIALLKNLKSLTKLFLAHNKISDISEIKELKGITSLNLSFNQISDISALRDLKNITSLWLESNQISDLSPITGLINLSNLWIGNNQISDISPLKELVNLMELNLSNNFIKEIPEWITNFMMNICWENKNNNNFCVTFYNNPLQRPPVEIIKQGKSAVINYFNQSCNESDFLYEAKLLIVGKGNVGKTWLLHKITTGKEPKNGKTTEGIDIKKWIVKTKVSNNFRINIWDFGGQEIYHATHQFFLTKRSLYLLIWESRSDDDLNISYWLNIIKTLSDNAPVIIVMNKCDERIKRIEENSLKNRYPNIIGFYQVSAKVGTNIQELIKEIKKQITSLSFIGHSLPKVWIDIRRELENHSVNYIFNIDYLKICTQYGLNEKQAQFLSDYYHDLGVFLHFRNNELLEDIVFLNPDWTTNAFYKIIDDKEVIRNYGLFQYDQLREIWKDYDENKYKYLLELMKEFELCFRLGDSRKYIVPELLRAECENLQWEFKNNLRFEYHYEFMPAGIITRFIARNHHIKKENNYWKNGVILIKEHAEALIICEPLNNKIKIWLRGKEAKELLYLIRKDIGEIHESLNKLEVKEMIPCICEVCRDNPNPCFYEYNKVKKFYFEKDIQNIQCGESGIDVNINRLIGNVLKEEFNIIREDYNKFLLELINNLYAKKHFLENEIILAYDAEKIFALKQQINNLKNQIDELKQELPAGNRIAPSFHN